jgi:hypothetical protein
MCAAHNRLKKSSLSYVVSSKQVKTLQLMILETWQQNIVKIISAQTDYSLDLWTKIPKCKTLPLSFIN